MTDWTALVIELEEAKSAMITAKKVVKADADREARRVARENVREKVEELEYAFAKRLAAANAQGLPQSVIRKEILRTGDWDTWVKWRDLAQIEPERVVIENLKRAKADAERPYRWADDYSALTILRVNGEEITPFIVRDWSVGNGPVQISYADKFIWLFQSAGLSMKDFDAAAISAIESAYSQGLIPARKSDWDAYTSREIDVTEVERRRAQNIEENGAWDE